MPFQLMPEAGGTAPPASIGSKVNEAAEPGASQMIALTRLRSDG
jgi:hypothetical protein